MIKKVILGIVAVIVIVIVGFVILVAMQPSEYQVARSATMPAPPAEVFPHVNDFHKWNAWSPWAKLDPDAKYTYQGPDAGEGAECHWVGNDEVGEGNMKITESVPNELIRIQLNFIKPFEDTADVEFQFAPAGEDQTEVTWMMSGKNNFMFKAMCLVMGMDLEEMIGKDYEKGLANMQKAVDSAPETASDDAQSNDTQEGKAG